jgi:hypothetical protein
VGWKDRGRGRSLIITHPGDEVLVKFGGRQGIEEKARHEARAGAPKSAPN